MPTISAVPFPTIPAVRVITSWGDVPGATHATVFREDCETGERVQLRPYVSYNGNGYLLLSCGMAIFWDTEVPLDRCVRYCTQAQNALGATVTTPGAPLLTDTFSRVVGAGGWGSADTGQPYTVAGTAADYSTNGSLGRITITAAGISRNAIAGGPWVDARVDGTVFPTVLATGAPIDQGFSLRRDSISGGNGYEGLIRFGLAGDLRVRINKVVAGSASNIAEVVIGTYASSSVAKRVAFLVWGNQMKIKAWDPTDPEPGWQLEITDNSVTTAGGYAATIRSQAGNTNFPFTASWDNVVVTDPYGNLLPVESCSTDLIVASSGTNLLRDPMRPCNDVHVGLRWSGDPNCTPTKGVVFARMEGEGYAANTQNLQAFNSPRPVPATRERDDAESSLVLVTKTFQDRDAVTGLLRAGGTLLWQSPPEYGIPDRYIQVGAATVARYNNDHRYQPRVISLPYVTVDRPEGPMQGICGARVKDLCDIYPSWTALAAANLSFMDLLEGQASPQAAPSVAGRRWIDVETGFASWVAVETAPNTWKTVRDGA